MDFKTSRMAKSLKNKKKIKCKIKRLKTYSDKRGWFVEMLKRNELDDDIKQISVASIKPGEVRGNHYHLKRIEWFFLIGGKAEFYLEDLKTRKKSCFKVSSKSPKLITVFPNTVHAIKNPTQETIFFVEAQNDIYNPKKPDKIPYLILS